MNRITLEIPIEDGLNYHVSVVPIAAGTPTYLFCLKEITIDGHLIPKFASFKLDPSGKFYLYSDDKDTTVISIQKARNEMYSRFFREEKIELPTPDLGDLKSKGYLAINTSLRYKVGCELDVKEEMTFEEVKNFFSATEEYTIEDMPEEKRHQPVFKITLTDYGRKGTYKCSTLVALPTTIQLLIRKIKQLSYNMAVKNYD